MRFVIIHGTKGSPQGNWFPWLKAKLEAQGHDVLVPEFPTPEGQDADSWTSWFLVQSMPDKNLTVIGHSIGATCLLNLLNEINTPIAASYFIAPVMGDIGFAEYDDLNRSFYETDFDWAGIRSRMGKAIIMHGDNDPYVPLSHAELLAGKLEVPLTIIPNGGHLNAETGFTDFPQLLASLT